MENIRGKSKYIILVFVCVLCSTLTTYFLTNSYYMTRIDELNKKMDSFSNSSDIKLADETSLSFSSDDVGYDNSTSGIQSNNVRGAIDELYACASDFTTYDTRLQGVETKVGTSSLNTTSQNLSGAVNELKNSIPNAITSKVGDCYIKFIPNQGQNANTIEITGIESEQAYVIFAHGTQTDNISINIKNAGGNVYPYNATGTATTITGVNNRTFRVKVGAWVSAIVISSNNFTWSALST